MLEALSTVLTLDRRVSFLPSKGASATKIGLTLAITFRLAHFFVCVRREHLLGRWRVSRWQAACWYLILRHHLDILVHQALTCSGKNICLLQIDHFNVQKCLRVKLLIHILPRKHLL